MKLRKYIQATKYGGYSSNRQILAKVKNDEQFIHILKQKYLGGVLDGVISTEVKGWWLFKKWILVVDCDDSVNKNLALGELIDSKIGYRVVESSTNRFWIITDFVGSFHECMSLLETIPGCDVEYRSFCNHFGKIFLRAFPKNGFYPSVVGGSNKFGALANRWFELFKMWWTSSIVTWIVSKQREEIRAVEEKIQYERLLKQQQEEEVKKIKEQKKFRSLRIDREIG